MGVRRRILMAMMRGGDKVKVKIGKFTGDGSLHAYVPCEFEPDIISVWCDANIAANPGGKALAWAVIQRDMYAAFQRYTNGTNVNPSSGTTLKLTGFGMSSYSAGTMHLWLENQSQNVFTSNAEFDYVFLKYSED
jgi:hypothetical protein